MSFPVFPCETIEREIKDFPNYTIDIYGKFFNRTTGKVLKHRMNHGYMCVILSNEGIPYHKAVHRILAETFLKNTLNKRVVDHIDRNKTNNSLENLRFCSYLQNTSNRTNIKSGVSYHNNRKGNEYYRAKIKFNNNAFQKYFPFTTEGKAMAYHWRICKELELFGEFAPRVKYAS